MKRNGTYSEVKLFVCSAQIVNGWLDGTGGYLNYDVDNELTNIPSSYYVPDDLYIYTFSMSNTEIVYVSALPSSGNSTKRYCVTSGVNTGKTYIWSGSAWIETTNVVTAEKLGLQVFNANGEAVFDSRFKYLDVLDSNWSVKAPDTFETDRAIAIADLSPNFGYGSSYDNNGARCFAYGCGGHILFEAGYQSKRSGPPDPFEKCHVGAAYRQLYTEAYTPSDWGTGTGIQGDKYMVLDVTGY